MYSMIVPLIHDVVLVGSICNMASILHHQYKKRSMPLPLPPTTPNKSKKSMPSMTRAQQKEAKKPPAGGLRSHSRSPIKKQVRRPQ
jgi:hypothetical protein